jgi:23S rRNA (guanosine2251-2'-O)-methyltransferase
LQAAALAQPHLADFLDELPTDRGGTLLLLDQVVDPQNLGSLLRSAAAFGALAVVMPHDRSPPLTGSVAKAASGALELVPIITVANLVQAMTRAKEGGLLVRRAG